MSFLDENAALTGGLILAGTISMQNARNAAQDRLDDNTGAAWIRYLTAEIKQRDATIAQLRADLSDERSGRLQAQSILRKMLNR